MTFVPRQTRGAASARHASGSAMPVVAAPFGRAVVLAALASLMIAARARAQAAAATPRHVLDAAHTWLTYDGDHPLSRRFGEREVLRALDLQVPHGDRIALHGPNGSGKTTVLRCILGTVTPTAGSVTVGGHPAGSLAARALSGAAAGRHERTRKTKEDGG